MDAAQVVVVAGIVLAVLAFVLWPMLAKRGAAAAGHVVDVDRLERRIADYRAALRRGTVCEQCLFANPEGARFCADCGTRLSAAAHA